MHFDAPTAATFITILVIILTFIWNVIGKLVIEPQRKSSETFSEAVVELRNLITKVSEHTARLEITVVEAVTELKRSKDDVGEVKESIKRAHKRIDTLAQIIGKGESI